MSIVTLNTEHASEPRFSFTVFKNTKGACTKTYHLKGGTLSERGRSPFYEGRATKHSVGTLEELRDVLDNLSISQATAYGVCDYDQAIVVQRTKLASNPGSIARTTDYFDWPVGGGIMSIDVDNTTLSREELHACLAAAVPALGKVRMLWRPSASSNIFTTEGKELRGLKGHRFLLFVDDAGAIPTVGKILYQRLWLAGHGYIEPSASGSPLERTLVDDSVWQPNKLDFTAGAKVESGLERRADPGYIFEGDFQLRTGGVEALTQAEKDRLDSLINAAKSAKAGECKAARERWIDVRITESGGSKLSLEERSRLDRIFRNAVSNSNLTADFTLKLDNGDEVTVGDVLANKLKYHGATGADPLEPEYGGGRNKARLYLTGTRPIYYSQAHGGRKFYLRAQTRELEVAGGGMAECVSQTASILAMEPDLFVNDLGPVVVTNDRIHLLSKEEMAMRAAGAIQYYKMRVTRDGAVKQLVDPPERYIATLRKLSHLPDWRRLNGIITAPTLRPDGTILQEPGHDHSTGLLLNVLEQPACIPENPSEAEIELALDMLMGPFKQYAFASDAHKGALLSALLTSAIRRSLPTAPAYIVDASAAGSGKTKLAMCIATLADGSIETPTQLMKNEEEFRKSLFGLLTAGAPAVVFDNINGRLYSDLLCMTLTAPSYSGRVLGIQDVKRVDTRSMMLFTGNNIAPVGDLCRRMISIRIDAGCEKPWSRKFDFDPIRLVRRHRQELVGAALTLLRGYISVGRPRMTGLADTGSFEEWSSLVRQCVVWLGFEDPELLMHTSLEGDDETEEIRSVYEAWEEVFGFKWVSNDEIKTALKLPNALSELMDDIKLGVFDWLRKFNDRVVGDLRISNKRVQGKRGWMLKQRQERLI
jgi:hypothetical protein